VTSENAKQIAEAFQMPGLGKFIGDQAKQTLVKEVGNKIAEWAAEGLHTLIGPKTMDQGPKTVNMKEAFAKDPQLSKKLKQEIQNKLQDWLPKMAKKAIYEGLLQKEMVGDENLAEFKEIEEEVVKALNTTFNEQAEHWMGGWYDRMIEDVKDKLGPAATIPLEALPQIFKGSIEPLRISNLLANQIGDAIGSSTVKGIQNNILKVLGGELPDEALKYLKMGPEKFQEYAEKYKQYLPAAQFAKLKDKVMGIHIVDLPNQVYGGILASSAAMHLAKAFAGMKVNFYELKRAKEVIETMVWQLRNKEAVSLNLGDFLGMVRMLGDQLGSFNWAPLKQVAKWNPANQVLEKLDWFEKQLKKVDDLYDQTTGKVLEGFDKAIGEIEGELKKFSEGLLSPFKIQPYNCIVAEGCSDIFSELPKLDNIFGEWGNQTPLDLLKKFYKDSGLEKDLGQTNKKIAGALAEAATWTADVLNITGPLAEVLDVEKVPAQNPSQDSDFDPVFLHNGEFYYTATDVTIPGPSTSSGDLPFQFTRIYRSASNFLGVLGHNWTHNFAEKLLWWDSPEGGGFTYISPEGKKYFFKKDEKGGFVSPKDLFVQLMEQGDGFEMLFENDEKHFFNRTGILQSIQNKEGNKISCFYNEQGQLIKIEDTLGRTNHFFYKKNGLLERFEDFSGRAWRFDYNDEAELIAASSPGTPSFPKGKTTGYRYQNHSPGSHKMTLVMDPKGQVYLQNFYGVDGKVLAQNYGSEEIKIEARYDGLNTWVKDRLNVMHLYEHDEEGHLLQHSILKQDGVLKNLGPAGFGAHPPTRLRSEGIIPKPSPKFFDNGKMYEYDLWGNVISITDPQGNIRKFEVDASNLITKEINNGEERRYFYDANDNIIKIEVPSKKLVVEFEYDMLDRMRVKKEYLSPTHVITTRFEYNPRDQLTRVVYPMGNEMRFEYDDEENLVKKGEEVYEYDNEGHLIAVSNSVGEKTQFQYDENGNLIDVISPLGNREKYEWDSKNEIVSKKYFDVEGNLLAAATPTSRLLFRDNPKKGSWIKSEESSRALRQVSGQAPRSDPREIASSQPATLRSRLRLLAMTNYDTIGRPLSIQDVQLEWDDNGRLTSLTDKEGLKTIYSYDGLNHLTLEHYPNNSEIAYEYDTVGRLISMKDRSQNLHQFTYDKEGHLIFRKVNAYEQRFVYDGLGRLVEARDLNDPKDSGDDVTIKLAYDSLSRLIAESINGRLVSKNYDEKDRKVQVRYPSGFSIVRNFDSKNNLAEIFADGFALARFQYDEQGKAKQMEWGNAVKLEQRYDDRQRLTEQSFNFPTKESPTIWQYAYREDGKLAGFEYTTDGGLMTPQGLQAGDIQRDVAGNLTQDDRFQYEYDPFGRLVAVRSLTHELLARYSYDPFNRLVRKELPTQKRKVDYIYDDWHAIETYENNALSQSIIFGESLDQPIALLAADDRQLTTYYYYHTDRLGSVRFLTDKSGAVAESYEYSPFGERMGESQIGNELGFIGRPHEMLTGLVNLRHRYYSPALREFLTADPLGYKNDFYAASTVFTPRNFSYHQGQGGASRTTYPNYVEQDGEISLLDIDLFYEKESAPAPTPEMNLYAYAGGDPVNFFDPLGLYKIMVTLPQYIAGKDNRRNLGQLTLFDEKGDLAVGPFQVLGRSSNKWWDKEIKKTVYNPNKGRDPVKKFGDTPTGTYGVEIITHPNDSTYGPHFIKLDPTGGDALVAEANGRAGIGIHGGGTNPIFGNGKFSSTKGCVRMLDGDIQLLVKRINELKTVGDTEGTVNIAEYENH